MNQLNLEVSRRIGAWAQLNGRVRLSRRFWKPISSPMPEALFKMCWIGRVLKSGTELNLLREFDRMYHINTQRTSLPWESRTRPLGLKSWNRKSQWAMGLGPWSPRIWPRGQDGISLDFGTLGWGADPQILAAAAAAELLQLCPPLHNPKDYSPPGSFVHGILQAKMLEWAAISSSWGSSWPRDLTCVSSGSWSEVRFFTTSH